MTEEEFILSIVAMVLGSGILIACIVKIGEAVNNWLKRGEQHYSDEEFSRLAKAFVQHKKDMERRMQNIESIVADRSDAEIDGDSGRSQIEYPELEEPKAEGTLSNQLEHKRKVR